MRRNAFGLAVSAWLVCLIAAAWYAPAGHAVVRESDEPHAIIQEVDDSAPLGAVPAAMGNGVLAETAIPPSLHELSRSQLLATSKEGGEAEGLMPPTDGEATNNEASGEESAEPTEEGGEEGGKVQHDEVATAFFCCLVALILGTIFFESIKDLIIESVEGTSLHPVVDAMFAELTVLGFIGLISFVLVKMGILREISMAVFAVPGTASEAEIEESKERVPEMFESLHMMLFLVMVIFIIEVMVLIALGHRMSKRWNVVENLAHEPERLEKVLQVWDDYDGCCRSVPVSCEAEEPWGDGELDFTLDYLSLRAEFVDPRDGFPLGNEYDFADYLAHVMGKLLSTIVTVTWIEWVLLLLIMAGFYSLSIAIDMRSQDISVAFTCFMYVLAFCVVALKYHLEWVFKQLVSRPKGKAFSERLVEEWKVRESLAREKMLAAKAAKTGKTGSGADDLSKDEGANGSNPESSTAPGTAHGAGNGAEAQAPEADDAPHPDLEANKTATESTHLLADSLAIDVDKANSTKKKKREVDPALLPPFKLREQATERGCFAKAVMGNALPNQHQALFMFENKGPYWNRTFLQVTLVCTAIFVPNIILTIKDFTQMYNSGELQLWEYVALLVFCAIPVFIIFSNMGKTLQAQLIAANIENHPGGNSTLIQKCKRSQQAKKVMYVLQLINRLRKKADIIANATASKKEPTITTPRLEIDPKRRKEIEDIFDFFDADQSGALDTEEIEKFLQSLGHTGDTEATAKMVVEELDQPDADGNPGNGEIEKEEFVEWMVASEAAASYDETNAEIALKMFNMFNDDGDEFVTPEEFNTKLLEFGIRLSDDELALLVRELDSDGSGRINEDDFEAMLERHQFA